MTTPRIAVIGAGVAGLVCARQLAREGLAPVILDKGRGIGGRMATRRAAEGLAFDHGATQMAATGAAFAQELQQAEAAGAVAHWPEAGSGDAPRFVGLPGMSGLARHLGAGLDIRSGTTVTSVRQEEDGCRIVTDKGEARFDRVALTVPAPQAIALLGPAHPLAATLARVRMDPCLTLMVAFGDARDAGPPLRDDADEGAVLSRIVRDSGKPGRDAGRDAYVAQAGVAFSRHHLDRDMAEVTPLLLHALCARLGRPEDGVVHAVTHRWRYARTGVPLGQDCLTDGSGRLFLGGDWCLGDGIEDAYRSGMALAAAILSRS